MIREGLREKVSLGLDHSDEAQPALRTPCRGRSLPGSGTSNDSRAEASSVCSGTARKSQWLVSTKQRKKEGDRWEAQQGSCYTTVRNVDLVLLMDSRGCFHGKRRNLS